MHFPIRNCAPEFALFPFAAGGEVFDKFSAEQLNALQWDEFEERIANAVEFDIVPEYDRLYDIYSAAIRARG